MAATHFSRNERDTTCHVGHSNWVTSITFSHDSKLLASASGDCTVKVWDTSNGQCLQTLERHSGSFNSVVFSHNSKLVASASDDHAVKVWDASNGQCLQTLDMKRVASIKSVDITNTYLETDIGTVQISSISDIEPMKTNPGAPPIQGYGVSSDRPWITWNSENLLWLPPEYRPSKYAVSLSTICLGCRERVLLFTFDSQRLPLDDRMEKR